MSRGTYLYLSGCVFCLVGVAHLARAAFSAAIVVEAWSVPIWMSWVAGCAATGLGIWGLRVARRDRPGR